MGNDPLKTTKSASGIPGAITSFKLSQEPTVPGRTIPEPAPVVEPLMAEVVVEYAPEPETGYDALGELPKTYETGSLFLAARDPHWLFVYWDVDLEEFDTSVMLDRDPVFYLKIFLSGGELVDQIKVNNQARNWYFPVKDAGVGYYVELGFNDIACKWAVIGQSNEVISPSDSFSDGVAEFATVPFHLSFQRMLDMVHEQMSSGDSLVSALSKLQSGGESSLKSLASNWTEEQKRLLEALVGQELVSQISLGSAEIDQVFRKRLSEALTEKLSSEASSELSFLRGLVGVESWLPGESSLSSAFSGSWSGAVGGASWQSGVGGLGALSTLGLGGASGGMELLGAFGSEVGASWSMAALGLGGSSWGWGGETSWAGVLGSSWSAQPFSVQRERGFFLHVNAEVIFYGGTHPDASVWIDGEPVTLTPDGSFRYHFRLPDGDFEVPIIAESPDGLEIRSATLSFKRDTVRTGEVGHTTQPIWLDEPMGRK